MRAMGWGYCELIGRRLDLAVVTVLYCDRPARDVLCVLIEANVLSALHGFSSE